MCLQFHVSRYCTMVVSMYTFGNIDATVPEVAAERKVPAHAPFAPSYNVTSSRCSMSLSRNSPAMRRKRSSASVTRK